MTSFSQVPMKGSELVFDDAVLARRARTTLAGADAGLLATGVPGARGTSARLVGVHDDDGEPVLRCDTADPISQAAARRQLATLRLAPNPTFGVWLALHGRLHPVRTERQRFLARLSVTRVGVGCPHRDEQPEAQQRPFQLLALEKYALARPDLLAAHAPRLARHLNERHHEQLRRLAVAVSGVPAERVAAACLTGLTAEAARLCCIDDNGARYLTLPFPAPAATPAQLSAALGRLLVASHIARPSR
ncbi:MAG TPA: DUF2470 domain-containing protein [Frankiaceae bacterium]|jgi:hypothetical protein|nr:DUF2470 domain-containing protein [Frankiaceae bacterium]